MRAARLALAAALLSLVGTSGAVAARPAAKPVAARDWTTVVAATPEGGFRMGNPAAAVKLVEYGSLTCSHCAHFAADGVPTLMADYVKTGKASYEYRNFVLNGVDVTATLLARCAGPKGFFAMAEELYASQGDWLGRVSKLPQAEKTRLMALPEGERLAAVAHAGGLTEVAARHGVTADGAAKCLSDPAGLDQLEKLSVAADAKGVQGTPTFLLNGENIGSHTWATLQPVLQRSLGT